MQLTLQLYCPARAREADLRRRRADHFWRRADHFWRNLPSRWPGERYRAESHGCPDHPKRADVLPFSGRQAHYERHIGDLGASGASKQLFGQARHPGARESPGIRQARFARRRAHPGLPAVLPLRSSKAGETSSDEISTVSR
jgi:hypothetical protein